jgi:hypothetical protein
MMMMMMMMIAKIARLEVLMAMNVHNKVSGR